MATKSLALVAFIMLTLGSVVTSFQIPLGPGGMGHRLVKRMARPDWVVTDTGHAGFQAGCTFCANGLSVQPGPPPGAGLSLLPPPVPYDQPTQYGGYDEYNCPDCGVEYGAEYYP